MLNPVEEHAHLRCLSPARRLGSRLAQSSGNFSAMRWGRYVSNCQSRCGVWRISSQRPFQLTLWRTFFKHISHGRAKYLTAYTFTLCLGIPAYRFRPVLVAQQSAWLLRSPEVIAVSIRQCFCVAEFTSVRKLFVQPHHGLNVCVVHSILELKPILYPPMKTDRGHFFVECSAFPL